MKTEIKDDDYDKILEIYLKYRNDLIESGQTGGNIKTLITNARFIENFFIPLLISIIFVKGAKFLNLDYDQIIQILSYVLEYDKTTGNMTPEQLHFHRLSKLDCRRKNYDSDPAKKQFHNAQCILKGKMEDQQNLIKDSNRRLAIEADKNASKNVVQPPLQTIIIDQTSIYDCIVNAEVITIVGIAIIINLFKHKRVVQSFRKLFGLEYKNMYYEIKNELEHVIVEYETRINIYDALLGKQDDEVEERMQDLQLHLHESDQTIKKMADESDTIKNQLEHTILCRDNLIDQVKVITDTLNDQVEELKDATVSYDNLLTEFDESKNNHTVELDTVDKTNEVLKKRVADLIETNKKKTLELKAQSELRRQDYMSNVVKSREKLYKAVQANRDYYGLLIKAVKGHNSLNNDLGNTKKELDAEKENVKELTAKLEEVMEKYEEANSKNTKLTSNLLEANSENTKLSSNLTNAKSENTELSSNLTNAKSENKDLNSNLSEAKYRNTKLTSTLTDANSKNTKLTSNLSEANSKNTKLTSNLLEANTRNEENKKAEQIINNIKNLEVPDMLEVFNATEDVKNAKTDVRIDKIHEEKSAVVEQENPMIHKNPRHQQNQYRNFDSSGQPLFFKGSAKPKNSVKIKNTFSKRKSKKNKKTGRKINKTKKTKKTKKNKTKCKSTEE